MNPHKPLIPAILNALFFFGIIGALLIVTLVMPKKDYSEEENRQLAEMPRLSASAWFSSDFSDGLSEYSREHFALRTGWISLRTNLERLGGHDEVNGVYFADGRLCEAQPPVEYEQVDKTVAAINSFGKKLDGRLSVMIAPTAAQIYADSMPPYSPDQEQRRMINYVYSALDSGIGSIDVYDALYKSRGDYIYYRTDHHWTAYGAYIAYCEYVRRLGYDAVPLDRINIEHASRSFLGSLHSKVLTDEAEPDVIDIYTSDGANVISMKKTDPYGNVSEYDGVFLREHLEDKDKYLTYLGENVPLVEITSDSGGGSLLIIKDSYANCFAPFLTKHFSKVTLVDMRYIMNIEDYVDLSEYSGVLILYNASTFAQDGNLQKLAAE